MTTIHRRIALRLISFPRLLLLLAFWFSPLTVTAANLTGLDISLMSLAIQR